MTDTQSTRVCVVPECDRPVHVQKRGLCSAHYARQRLGIPMDRPIRPHNRPTAERLWRRMDLEVVPARVDECWEWPGARTTLGYGSIGNGAGRNAVYTHRVAYDSLIDPIPDGLVLDHLCHNPPCLNPWHLEPVTQAVNISINRRRPA